VIKVVEEDVEIEEQELVSVQDMSEYADVGETDAIFVEEEIEEEQIFDVVEENPEFPGGMKELAKYLRDNIDYPRISRDNNSQGRAFVQFTVNADGSIQDVEIIRSSGDIYLDKEAIRVVESMPKWKPGKQQGKAVRVKFRLPINFRLQ
jgi:protein TonB